MELHYIYSSPDIIMINKSGIMTQAAQENCAEKMRKSYRDLVEKSKLKMLLGRPRRRWEGSIKVDLKETGWEGAE
jgi:hypothetical protein